MRVACKSTKAVRDGAKKHKAFIALKESIVCLVAANDQQHFQAPVQELVSQHILPSPHITMNSASTKQGHPHSHIWVTGFRVSP